MKNKLTLRLYLSKKELRWSLLSANGRKLANSGEGYKKKADLFKAIALILGDFRQTRHDIEINDQTGLDIYRYNITTKVRTTDDCAGIVIA